MKFIQLTFVLLFSSIIYSQNKLIKTQQDSIPNSIENQIKNIDANNWQDYKMIKKNVFSSFQKNILDSISTIKKEIIAKDQIINKQEIKINSLNDKIASIDNKLNSSLKEVDSIFLFGVQMSKTAYNSLLWGIIICLLLGLGFFVFKFKNSHILTKNAKNSLAEIEQEFELFRKRTLEKEQKLRRQLQDEINKQRGI